MTNCTILHSQAPESCAAYGCRKYVQSEAEVAELRGFMGGETEQRRSRRRALTPKEAAIDPEEEQPADAP